LDLLCEHVFLVSILVSNVVMTLARAGVEVNTHNVAEERLGTEAFADTAAKQGILLRLIRCQRYQLLSAAGDE